MNRVEVWNNFGVAITIPHFSTHCCIECVSVRSCSFRIAFSCIHMFDVVGKTVQSSMHVTCGGADPSPTNINCWVPSSSFPYPPRQSKSIGLEIQWGIVFRHKRLSVFRGIELIRFLSQQYRPIGLVGSLAYTAVVYTPVCPVQRFAVMAMIHKPESARK